MKRSLLTKTLVLVFSLVVGLLLSLSALSVTSAAEELTSRSMLPALRSTLPAPLYRITVQGDGLYALDYNTLQAAGLPVDGINPHTFRLFWMGQEVPLRELGDGAGSFEPGEALLFYGQGVDSLFRDGVLPTHKYTANSAFFLTYGAADGLRMAEKDGAPGSGTPAASFLQTVHLEENREYKAQYPPQPNADHWVWWWIEPPSRSYRDFTFMASHIASGSFSGKLTVAMLGFNDGFHHLNLYVNGKQVLNGRPRWGGYEVFETTVDVPQAFFREGTNTIRVELSNVGRNARAVAFSPGFATDRTLFAGTLGGIFRSTDGGSSWNYTNTGLSNLDIRALAVSPNFASDQTLFAGTWDGVFRSANGGGSWSAVNSGLTHRDVRALAVSPSFALDSTLFAGTYGGGVFTSGDGGATWNAVNDGLADPDIQALAVSPAFASDRTLWAGSNGGGVFQSSDGGATWSAVNTGLPNLDVRALAVSPSFALDSTLFAGTYGGGVFTSGDGGAAWNGVNDGLADPDIQALAVSPAFASDRTLWAGSNGGGVFQSSDGGATWSAVNTGLPNLDVRALAVSPNVVADQTLLAGTYGSSVFWSRNGGSNWSAVNIASKFYDKGYVNWLEVGYYDTFVAEGNVLAFGGDAASLYEVTGFTSNDVEVYDVSDVTHVQRFINTTVAGGTVRFGDASASRYLALTPAAWLTPLGFAEVTYPTSPYTPADLLDTANGADYILISHADFWPQALRLASYRAADLGVALIDVQQIYDQFNGGLMSAEAIRDFLQYAYDHWRAPRPAFVVLLGDGTYDMRQYLGNSAPTYIPPFLYLVDERPNGETAADNRFVTVAGDDIMPDMHIGRLPANSLAEAEAMVDKIIAYELGCACDAWSQHVLFVADDLQGGGGNFYAYSDGLADGYADPPANTIKYLPQSYTSTKVYLGPPPDGNCDTPAACSAEITRTLNTTGALLTSYIGHSLKTVWGAEDRLLDQAALATLEGNSCLPIMLAMTCETGVFHEPQLGFSSLGEAAVRQPGRGAVAYWGAAGSGLASGQDFLEKGFFLALFHGGADRAGVAVTEGKRYLLQNTPPGNYDNLVDMFTLFGDPALKVKVENNCSGGAIGDFVWWDVNGNGQQDPGEPGIPGVDVVLSDNVLVSTTDASGFYTFANVPAGAYTLKIGDAEFQAGGTLYNWLASPRGSAAPDLDSDGDEVTHVADVILEPGEVMRATDFGFHIPSGYVLTQELNTREPIPLNGVFSFTIHVANCGSTTISTLPLRYVYSTTHMSYESAIPAPDDNVDDGMIDWGDLSASFGQDLGPGASFTVVVTFTARTDTTRLSNEQTVTTALVDGARADPDGSGPLEALEELASQESSAGVEINNPTGLTLAALSGVARPDGVLMAWETVSELHIVGFNILRREASGERGAGSGEREAVNDEFIFAARAGANEGAAYTYQDRQAIAGSTYEYVLEMVKSDGSVEQSGPAWVTVGWWAMLPLVM